jgi:pyridoxal biosynthesis lyase PdxS
MVHAFDASIQVNASMQVNTLLESSAESAVAGDAVMALERIPAEIRRKSFIQR